MANDLLAKSRALRAAKAETEKTAKAEETTTAAKPKTTFANVFKSQNATTALKAATEAATASAAADAIGPSAPSATGERPAAQMPTQSAEQPTEQPTEQPKVQNAAAQLAAAVASVDVSQIASDAATGKQVSLAKYEYDGQIDNLPESAIESFEQQLQILSDSLSTNYLTENIKLILQYIDAHDFLRDILKPEQIQIMVRALRKSYSSALAGSQQRKTSAAKTKQKDAVIMDALDGFIF